jgi:hypothetical protein
MIEESMLKKGDHVLWKKEDGDEFDFKGVIFERVRARVKPKYTGPLIEDNKHTQREVSYILTAAGRYHWINVSMIKLEHSVEAKPVLKMPVKEVQKKAVPALKSKSKVNVKVEVGIKLKDSIKAESHTVKDKEKKVALKTDITVPKVKSIKKVETRKPEVVKKVAEISEVKKVELKKVEVKKEAVADLNVTDDKEVSKEAELRAKANHDFSTRFPHPDPYNMDFDSILKFLRPSNLTSL